MPSENANIVLPRPGCIIRALRNQTTAPSKGLKASLSLRAEGPQVEEVNESSHCVRTLDQIKAPWFSKTFGETLMVAAIHHSLHLNLAPRCLTAGTVVHASNFARAKT